MSRPHRGTHPVQRSELQRPWTSVRQRGCISSPIFFPHEADSSSVFYWQRLFWNGKISSGPSPSREGARTVRKDPGLGVLAPSPATCQLRASGQASCSSEPPCPHAKKAKPQGLNAPRRRRERARGGTERDGDLPQRPAHEGDTQHLAECTGRSWRRSQTLLSKQGLSVRAGGWETPRPEGSAPRGRVCTNTAAEGRVKAKG